MGKEFRGTCYRAANWIRVGQTWEHTHGRAVKEFTLMRWRAPAPLRQLRSRRTTMLAKNSSISAEIYQIKVTLLGTRPPIWRRLISARKCDAGAIA